MFSEQRMPSGIARTIASTVPHRPICTVTIISLRYSSQLLKSGGKKSAAKVAMLLESRISAGGFISAPCQDQANTTKNSPQPISCDQERLAVRSEVEVVVKVVITTSRSKRQKKPARRVCRREQCLTRAGRTLLGN